MCKKVLGCFIISLFTAVVLTLGTTAVSSSAADIPQNSCLPVVYINSDVRANMVGKKEYTGITLTVEGEGFEPSQLYSGAAYLRLRGNSTANLTKKPYKLKLETKTDLLGMGKSKHWVLLANSIDLTNVRNYMLQSLAGELGLDSMRSKLVSLVYNGTYMGVYELCEQVRIGKSRVDIYDWEELAKDVSEAVVRKYISDGSLRESDFESKLEKVEETLKADYSWVSDPRHMVTFEYLGEDTVNLAECYDFDNIPAATGGVLMEMDFYEGSKANLMTAYRLPLYMSFPSYTETEFSELEDYMKEYVQAMEYSMHSTDFTFRNTDVHSKTSNEGFYDWRAGKRSGAKYKTTEFTSDKYDNLHYTDFVDIDSVINYMLLCEVSDNWDCMKNSFFMYKDIDSKIKFGPAWDFDWAWGNSMYGIDTAGGRGNSDFQYAKTWETTNDWFANEQYYQTQQFNRLLIRDPYFVVKLYERYHEVRDIILAMPERFDELTALYEADCEANYERWRATDSCGGLAGKTYNEQVAYTRNFIRERITWLDAQFESVDTLMKSLNYYCISDGIEVTDIDTAGDGVTTVTAAVTEPKAAKVSFQVNGKYFVTGYVENGAVTVDIPDSAIEAENGRLSVVQLRAVGADGAYVKNVLGSDGGVYINAVSNYATFVKTVQTVSDETIRREGDDELPDSSGEEGKKSAVPVIAIVLVIIVAGGIGMSMIAKKSKR